MALTATAHASHAGRELPAWEDAIVPALRKRLESESRMLTKRMSSASIPSADESAAMSAARGAMPDFGGREQARTPSNRVPRQATSPTPQRPSAIPRPSLQYSRGHERDDSVLVVAPSPSTSAKAPAPAQGQAQLGHGPAPGIKKRTRTQSTPGIPTPASSRSNSPLVVKSRIPTVSKSASPPVPVPAIPNGRHPTPRSGTLPPPSKYPSPDPSPELYPAAKNGSRSSVDQPRLTASTSTHALAALVADLRAEPPPFESSVGARLSFSNDEAERPFEHWYRGEAMRNGGVGELRVARQAEMLEIATYGHRLAPTPNGAGRRRAGSVSRESWIEDSGPSFPGTPRVLDEMPLTDLEQEELSEFGGGGLGGFGGMTAESSPVPTHAPSLAAPPSLASLVAEQSPALAQKPSSSSLGKRPSPAQQFAIQQTRGTRAKPVSAAAAPAPAAAPSPVAAPKPKPAARKAQPRAKKPVPPPVVTTPTPTDGDMEMYAIPHWTQPIADGRQWDDVVLPAVAKKMGLDGYTYTDGTPQRPAPTADTRTPPAPGTFGIDPRKGYRARPDHLVAPAGLQLDEFGTPGERTESGTEEEPPRQQVGPILRPLSPPRSDPPPSPAPFSSYTATRRTPPVHTQPQAVQVAEVPRVTAQQYEVEKREEKEGAGCCRCVIM